MRKNVGGVCFVALVVLATVSTRAWNGGWVESPPHAESGASAPEQDDDRERFVRFIAFGDMGTGDNDQIALAKRMALWQNEVHFDTVLLLGDNIYPDGNPADIPAKFEKPYEELLRRGVRFYAVLGNHDVEKGREGQINYPNFNMGGRAYYSFVKSNGLAEFFALDSNNIDAAQLRWLENALASSKAIWKLAYFHHPIYSSGKKHGSDTVLRAKLEPLFVQYGVAAVFSGHDHIYERTKLQQGIQYFVAGAGSGKLRRGDLNRGTPFFLVGNDETSSFLSVEATREQLSFKAIDSAGDVFDSGDLLSKAAKPQPLSLSMPLTIPPMINGAKLPASMNKNPVSEAPASANQTGKDAQMSGRNEDMRKREEKERHKKEQEE